MKLVKEQKLFEKNHAIIMKLPENLNEFKRGIEPKKAMNVGKMEMIKNKMIELNIDIKNVEITDNYMILPKNNPTTNIIDLAIEMMDKDYSNFLKSITKNVSTNEWGPRYYSNNISNNEVKDAIEKGDISLDEMEILIKAYAPYIINNAIIYLTKLKRTPEDITYDNNTNIYIFIGYIDKVPIEINGKKYYEDKFAVESMVKIDKFNPNQLNQVDSMKIIMRYQNYTKGGVYLLKVDKNIMDEDRYSEIPEDLQYIFDNDFENMLTRGTIKKL